MEGGVFVSLTQVQKDRILPFSVKYDTIIYLILPACHFDLR